MNTPPSPSEDPLEAMLKRNPAPIPDDGFTTRVLASLPSPAPKPRHTSFLRLITCFVGGLAGIVCAILTSGMPRPSEIAATGTAILNWTTKLTENGESLIPLANSAGIIALALAIAFSRNIAARIRSLDLL